MRATSTLFQFLSDFLIALPPRLLRAVEESMKAIWTGQDLSITGIGRNICGKARVKHNIKRVYRRLSNPDLHRAFNSLFANIAAKLIRPGSRPILLVDWTCFDKNHYALVAAVPHQGRAIPIYVAVHPTKHHATPNVERAFLHTLHHIILPNTTTPVLITDAGFRNPWLKQVRRLGWDFVGRLRGPVTVQPVESTSDIWQHHDLLFPKATATPSELGRYRCAKKNPLTSRLVTVKYRAPRQPSQRRSGPNPAGTNGEKYRKGAKEPWLLVTSLDEATFNATAIVGLYALRMQIEETFRDDKNRDSGVGLDASRSQTPEHLRGLRWLGALTSILTHTVGQVGEMLALHRHYQSNTTSERRVLSLPFLGRQLLQHEDRRRLTLKRLRHAWQRIQATVDVSRFATRCIKNVGSTYIENKTA